MRHQTKIFTQMSGRIGGALPVWDLGWRRSAQVGVGMMPRGEVGIVVAQIGLGRGVVNQETFGVVLFMAIATTLIAPPILKPLFANEAAPTPAGGVA
jgi:Kef-type K+ transport system membrane component KefB